MGESKKKVGRLLRRALERSSARSANVVRRLGQRTEAIPNTSLRSHTFFRQIWQHFSKRTMSCLVYSGQCVISPFKDEELPSTTQGWKINRNVLVLRRGSTRQAPRVRGF